MNNLFITLFLLVLIPFITSATIINVPANQPSIQDGINAAVNNDTVLVADGTYYENINFKGKAITVASHYLINMDTSHISNTTIDGGFPLNPDSGSVVFFVSGEDTNSVLCGFTITGGTGTKVGVPNFRVGGGILITNSGSTIRNNLIINNTINDATVDESMGGGISAGQPMDNSYIIIDSNKVKFNSINGKFTEGAGISSYSNQGRITNNIIENNTLKATTGKSIGGGICYFNHDYSTSILISKNEVLYNKSETLSNDIKEGMGGGIYFLGLGTIEDNVIMHNFVNSIHFSAGAGVVLSKAHENTVFQNNKVAFNTYGNGNCIGGGVCIWRCDASLINNIIFENTGYYGGGIYFGDAYDPSNAKIINNTISNNNSQYGGGIYSEDSYPIIMNTIIWGDSANSGPEIYYDGGTVTVDYCDVLGGWTGLGNIDTDPLFADSLFHLNIGSPCKNAGNPDSAYNDPDGSRNDMGAYGGPGAPPLGLHVLSNSDQLPTKIKLLQNYPNPFNPNTTIEFSIPKTEFVTLNIFNVLGQEIATLVAKRLTPGKYKYDWDASHLASGIYYYQISTEKGFNQTRKLVLMK